ncbi:HflX-like GTP-binding protein [Streptomyces sp. NPDC055607]
MHRQHGRGRRPARRARGTGGPADVPPFDVTGSDVVLVGYFSARQRDFAALMDAAAAELAARGARVVARAVQRRGVSHGGARKTSLPFSSRTLLSGGKAREVVEARERTDADAVVFLNALTGHQRHVLTGLFRCPVVSLAETPPPV